MVCANSDAVKPLCWDSTLHTLHHLQTAGAEVQWYPCTLSWLGVRAGPAARGFGYVPDARGCMLGAGGAFHVHAGLPKRRDHPATGRHSG